MNTRGKQVTDFVPECAKYEPGENPGTFLWTVTLLSTGDIMFGGQTRDGVSPNSSTDYYASKLLLMKKNNSMSELDKDLSIYPNPLKGKLNITSDVQILQVMVVNMQGQTILNKTVNENRVELNTRHLASGIYMLKVETERGWVSRKMVK